MKKFVKVCFSIVIFVFLLGFLWWAYQKGNTDVIKIACVGDSITFRHGFDDAPENNYPYVLSELLGEKYEVSNFGESGTCVLPEGDCPYVTQEVYQKGLAYEADILIFMLGTNDTKAWNWKDKETFRQEYEALLDSYLQKETVPTVYIGISPKAFYIKGETSGAAGFGIQPEIVDEMVEIQLEVAEERGYSVINIYELSVENPEWFEEDGIHPTIDGAKGIAEEVKKVICNEKEVQSKELGELNTIACVGDSLTFRRAYENETIYNYSHYLQDILEDNYEVKNFGEAGVCVKPDGNYPYEALRVYEASLKCEADIVIIMLGTNDIWEYNWVGPEEFKREYIKLLEKYIQMKSNPKVYLCTLPCIFDENGEVFEGEMGQRLDILSDVITEIAGEYDLALIDMNTESKKHFDWYCEDHLHFSNKGAKAVAKYIEQFIADEL